jgi:hypothetical protein
MSWEICREKPRLSVTALASATTVAKEIARTEWLAIGLGFRVCVESSAVAFRRMLFNCK